MEHDINFAGADLLVPEDQRARECIFDDLKRHGAAADERMAALASGDAHREQLTLAAMLLAEFSSYSDVAPGYLDRVLAPIIDCVAARLPPSGHAHPPSDDSINDAARLAHHAERYHSLISALMNTAQRRMVLIETPSGRLVFEPTSEGVLPELRDKWLYLRWHRSREEAGTSLAAVVGERVADVGPRLDMHLAEHSHVRSIPNPDAQWWSDHVELFAERSLEAQFAEVPGDERWGGGVTGAMARCALKPLLRFAVSTMLTNLRACRIRIAQGHRKASAIPHSCVPVLSRSALVELFTEGGLSPAQADQWVSAFTRSKGGERESLHSHPVVQLGTDTYAVLPSAIVYANLSLIVQQHFAGATLGAARCSRHTAEVGELFRGHGYAVATDVDLVVQGQAVTDLDVVTATPDGKLVVVFQLKSFVPRTNLLDLEKAAAYVSDAARQCDLAVEHREKVKEIVEEKLGIAVPADWELHQFIVVDLVAGSSEPERYPTLSLEWLRFEGPPALTVGLQELVERATQLHDGAAWFATVRPVYGLLDLSDAEPMIGCNFAICNYWAPPPTPRTSPEDRG